MKTYRVMSQCYDYDWIVQAENETVAASLVIEEIERLRRSWGAGGRAATGADLLLDVLGEERVDALDRFDAVQLADVITVCRGSKTLSDAGRKLFAMSRRTKAKPNDADRLRKYLAKFGLSFAGLG